MSKLKDKSVKIREEHEKWVERNAINFSKWVRMRLDEAIEDED